MENRKLVLLTIVLFAGNLLFSQTPVGYRFDINGQPFNGYFDPLLYSPEKKLKEVHGVGSYEMGYYYDDAGNKISSLLKFNYGKIWYRDKRKKSNEYLNPKIVKNAIIGVDSFFTITNYQINPKTLRKKPVYAQFIAEFNKNTFVKLYYSTSTINFLVKKDNSSIWEVIPNGKHFKEYGLKYFGHIPYLKEKIEKGEYDGNDILSAIKMAEYLEKYRKSIPIYYDKYWQEVLTKQNAKYNVKITDKNDSIWTFVYHKGSTKIYSVDYTSFYPNIKNGNLISYYPNSAIRQVVTYENNAPKEVKNYSNDGLLNIHYQYVKNKNSSSKEYKTEIKYLSVIDSLGNNVIQQDKIGNFNFFDDFRNVTYIQTYSNNRLIESYRMFDGEKVFQITEPKHNLKINTLQVELAKNISAAEYKEALNEGAQGTMLISLLIDADGYVIEAEILNKVHPQLDKLIDEFINKELLAKSKLSLKAKPKKKKKKNIFVRW